MRKLEKSGDDGSALKEFESVGKSLSALGRMEDMIPDSDQHNLIVAVEEESSNLHKHDACLMIQKCFRMFLARRYYKELSSAITIQAGFRGMAARKILMFRRYSSILITQSIAAAALREANTSLRTELRDARSRYDKMVEISNVRKDMELQVEELKRRLQLTKNYIAERKLELAEPPKVAMNDDSRRKAFHCLFVSLITLIIGSLTASTHIDHLSARTRTLIAISGICTLSLATLGTFLATPGRVSCKLLSPTLGLTVMMYLFYVGWIMLDGNQGFSSNVVLLLGPGLFFWLLYMKLASEIYSCLSRPCFGPRRNQLIASSAVKGEASKEFDIMSQPLRDMLKYEKKDIEAQTCKVKYHLEEGTYGGSL